MSIGLETREGLFAVMEQIASERETAREIVQQLLSSNAPLDDIDIPEGWRTAGMVMELAEFAFSRLEADPQQSLSLSLLTLTIAKSLACDPYPPTLRAYLEGRAWKEVGYANRYLDRYDNSIRAFESAEAALSGESVLIHEEAGARFGRACVFFLAAKYEEAFALNATTLGVFRSVEDHRRETQCEVLDAMIAHIGGDFHTAKTKFEAALAALRNSDDLHTLGVVHNGLARTYRALNRTSDAVTALERAREIFAGLEMQSEVNRADCGLAVILMESGDPEKALPLLHRIREDYLSRHMPEDAGEVGLYIVDALIMTDRLDSAKVLTGQVLKEFVDAKLNRFAISALAYLRDLLQTTNDPRAAVRHVRSYFEKSRSEPARIFLPLDRDEK